MPIGNRVRRGQKVIPDAAQENALRDAADEIKRLRGKLTAQNRPDPPLGDSRIRNQTGERLEAGAIVALTGSAFDSTSHEFWRRPLADAEKPTGDTKEVLAICAEMIPAKAGTIGRVWTVGLAPAKIKLNSAEHRFCRAVTDNVTTLETASSGPAALIERQSDGAGLVRLGGGGSGTGAARLGRVTAFSAGEATIQPRKMDGGSLADDTAETTLDALDAFGSGAIVGDTVRYYELGEETVFELVDLEREVKADAAITAGNSGTCSIYESGSDTGDDITVHLKWMDGGVDLASGTEGKARFSIAAGRWELLQAEC